VSPRSIKTLKNTKSIRRRGDAVTIHEVAKRAGVSPMTVSRVINRNSNVSEDKRKSVMLAVKELNYTPNAAARSLAVVQGTRIALIYTNPSSAYLRELLVGALDGSSRTAAQLVIESWEHLKQPSERSAARALAQSVAGVVLPPPFCESKSICSELVAADIPVVAIASGRFRPEFSSVRVDDFRAAHEMTEHLISFGHTRIGFIKGHPSHAASAMRYEGFVAAMKSAGVTVDPSLVQGGLFTYRSALEATEKLLDRKRPPTAIFASNDDMAAAAISVAHRRGLDVPRDLSVVGFDDTASATTVWPELTTVRQPVAAMAATAIELLERSMRRRKEGEPRIVIDHIVPHLLVRRDSVSSPAIT
jgi:LacI family transcriptional regulator